MAERVGSPLAGRLRKRWIHSVNDCLKKGGWNVWEARRIVYDRNDWLRFVRENGWGVAS